MTKREYFEQIAGLNDKITKLLKNRDNLITQAFKEHKFPDMTTFQQEYNGYLTEMADLVNNILAKYKP